MGSSSLGCNPQVLFGLYIKQGLKNWGAGCKLYPKTWILISFLFWMLIDDEFSGVSKMRFYGLSGN